MQSLVFFIHRSDLHWLLFSHIEVKLGKKKLSDSVKNEIQIHPIYVCVFVRTTHAQHFRIRMGCQPFVRSLQQILNLASSQMQVSIFLFLHRPIRPCNLDSKCICFCFLLSFGLNGKTNAYSIDVCAPNPRTH